MTGSLSIKMKTLPRFIQSPGFVYTSTVERNLDLKNGRKDSLIIQHELAITKML